MTKPCYLWKNKLHLTASLLPRFYFLQGSPVNMSVVLLDIVLSHHSFSPSAFRPIFPARNMLVVPSAPPIIATEAGFFVVIHMATPIATP